MKMLYSQRQAYARMGRWRPFHWLLWTAYSPTLSRVGWGRRLWGKYRKHWPHG